MSYVEITDANFEDEVIKSSIPVLVDFWAPWCGPCRIIGPIIEEIAKETEGRFKICKCNVDENQIQPAKYGIRSIPTMMFFLNGNETKTLIGVRPKEEIIQVLESMS